MKELKERFDEIMALYGFYETNKLDDGFVIYSYIKSEDITAYLSYSEKDAWFTLTEYIPALKESVTYAHRYIVEKPEELEYLLTKCGRLTTKRIEIKET